MNTHIGQTLNARRTRREENEKGFTLIELLVVVLIIGILSAIAIPIFLGQQNQAKDAAAKSDLTTAKIAMIGYATANNGAYPAQADFKTALKPFGYAQSDGITADMVVFADGTTLDASKFCLSQESSTGTIFKILDGSGVTGGSPVVTACAGFAG